MSCPQVIDHAERYTPNPFGRIDRDVSAGAGGSREGQNIVTRWRQW